MLQLAKEFEERDEMERSCQATRLACFVQENEPTKWM